MVHFMHFTNFIHYFKLLPGFWTTLVPCIYTRDSLCETPRCQKIMKLTLRGASLPKDQCTKDQQCS